MSELDICNLITADADLQLKNIAEEYLTRMYGKAHGDAHVGLQWLLGRNEGRHCLDHPEYRTKDRKRTLNANPYGLNLESLVFLVDLAKRKGLYLYIQSPSNYNTGTVLVILTEKKPNQ